MFADCHHAHIWHTEHILHFLVCSFFVYIVSQRSIFLVTMVLFYFCLRSYSSYCLWRQSEGFFFFSDSEWSLDLQRKKKYIFDQWFQLHSTLLSIEHWYSWNRIWTQSPKDTWERSETKPELKYRSYTVQVVFLCCLNTFPLRADTREHEWREQQRVNYSSDNQGKQMSLKTPQ